MGRRRKYQPMGGEGLVTWRDVKRDEERTAKVIGGLIKWLFFWWILIPYHLIKLFLGK